MSPDKLLDLKLIALCAWNGIPPTEANKQWAQTHSEKLGKSWDKWGDVCLAVFNTVPIEPTEKMLDAYCAALEHPADERARPWHILKAKKRWKSMLEAHENEAPESRRPNETTLPSQESGPTTREAPRSE